MPGRLAVLPRKRLDEIICTRRRRRRRAHVRAGCASSRRCATAPAASSAPACSRAIACARSARRWLVLASGAQPQATIAAGLCDRRTPSGIALRGYVENAAMTAKITSLEVVWHKRLSPGYGWIFPCGGDVFNIGVGVAQSHRAGKDGKHAMQDVNLREVFAAFKEPVRAGARARRGRPLAGRARPRAEGRAAALLARGRAARGARRPRHRRGGGQHLRLHRRGHRQGDGDRAACRRGDPAAPGAATPTTPATRRSAPTTRRASLSLKPRFDLYEEANRANAHPWLIDLLVWSARRSPRRVQRMAGVLEETHIPTDAVTVRGVLRRLVDWR